MWVEHGETNYETDLKLESMPQKEGQSHCRNLSVPGVETCDVNTAFCFLTPFRAPCFGPQIWERTISIVKTNSYKSHWKQKRRMMLELLYSLNKFDQVVTETAACSTLTLGVSDTGLWFRTWMITAGSNLFRGRWHILVPCPCPLESCSPQPVNPASNIPTQMGNWAPWFPSQVLPSSPAESYKSTVCWILASQFWEAQHVQQQSIKQFTVWNMKKHSVFPWLCCKASCSQTQIERQMCNKHL